MSWLVKLAFGVGIVAGLLMVGILLYFLYTYLKHRRLRKR